MAQPNALNPNFQGPIKAQNFKRSIITAQTNGTTAVNLWTGNDYATNEVNPFAGSVIAIKVFGIDSTAGVIKLKNHWVGGSAVLIECTKDPAMIEVRGSAVQIGNNGNFVVEGSLVATSSTAGNAVVEVTFQTTT